MKFSKSRKVVKSIKSKNLQKDFMQMIARIEKRGATDKIIAGSQVSSLIGLTIGLQHTLPVKLRSALLSSIFDDAIKNDVPHQWERVYDHTCDGKGNCTVPKEDWVCMRDTFTNTCVSLPNP